MQQNDEMSDFEQHAAEGTDGLFREILGYLGETKKWWLTPILVVLAAVGLLLVLGGTGLAPFIYTLF